MSTDKVDTEIPSPIAGVLVAITVGEDQVVEVGAEIGVLGTAGSGPAAPSAPPAAAPPEPTPAQSAPAAAAPHPPAAAAPAGPRATAAEVGYVTPLVRKLAAEYAVDLASVTGTGVGGRIRKQDVLDAAKLVAQRSAQPASPKRPQRLQSLRRHHFGAAPSPCRACAR